MNIDIDVLRATIGDLVLQTIMLRGQLKEATAAKEAAEKKPAEQQPPASSE